MLFKAGAHAKTMGKESRSSFREYSRMHSVFSVISWDLHNSLKIRTLKGGAPTINNLTFDSYFWLCHLSYIQVSGCFSFTAMGPLKNRFKPIFTDPYNYFLIAYCMVAGMGIFAYREFQSISGKCAISNNKHDKTDSSIVLRLQFSDNGWKKNIQS